MKVKKKGFTITELVIVIAVIAILAAVLIPTFSNVIEKANESAASSACSIAVTEYITMVTLDSDPDNNDATGVVFSNDNYYYVYSGGKLHYIGNTEKDSAKLLAVTSYDTDISALMGFDKQPPVEEGTAVYDNKIKFTIGEQTVEVDLTDTTRTLYLYNVDIDGTTYAGFFTINNTYGGSGNVIQTVNYSYESGISQDEVKVGQVQTSSLDNLVLESIEASYLPTTAICKGDSDGDAENQVTITKDQFKVTANYSDSDGNIVNRILLTNEYELINNVIDTSQVGSHIITIKHTASDIQTTCQIKVEEKHTKDYYFYNSYGWTEVFAYSWAENIVAVKPVANDFVLAGEILGEGIHWELSSSIKMFFDEKNNEWSVTGLKIPNGVPFKLAQVNELGDGLNIKTLCKSGTGGYCDGYITVGDGISCDILTNEYNNITLTNNKSDTGFGVYNIYWRTGNILHIDLAEDQTDIKKPNYAIFSKTLTNPWDKEKGTTGDEMTPYPKKGEGWWKVSLDSRSQYVLFNNGNVDATIAGGSKTRDITIYDDKPYCIDSAFYSEYKMYYFYNAYGWGQVYANASTTESIALMSTSTSADFGIKMTAVEGGWFAVPVGIECNTIVFSDGTDLNKTDPITIDNEKNYYIGGAFYSDYTTYYFFNAYGWGQVYANASTAEPIALMSTSTSTDIGIRMTAVEGKPGWFAVPVASECNTIVFSDGTDTNKTDELTIDTQNKTYVYYNPNNATADGGGWSSSIKTTIYYFYNAACWENVYAYYWIEGGLDIGWHGVKMTAVDGQDGWFSIEIDNNFEKVVFNDGLGDVEGVNKTADLTLNSKTPYYNDGWMATMHTHTYSGDCDATCNECGATRETTAEHTYDDACDTDCNVCGEVRETTHDYVQMHDETYHWEECSVCKQTTEKVEHVWNEGLVTKEPTCIEVGVKTFTCECGTTKIEEIQMLPHNPDSEWTSDETYHWHACGGCNEQLDKAEHLFNQQVATEEYLSTSATCTAKATYYYSCECGAKGAETFGIGDALGHAESEGWFTDETDHWKQCTRCQVELSKSAHTGGMATCTEQATCEVCNQKYGELAEHDFVDNVCQHCNSVKYYFYNYLNWTGTISAYAWTGEAGSETKYLGNFPGTAMTPDTENAGWYYIVVNGDAKNIIFNNVSNNVGNKTYDLDLNSATPYYCINGWKDKPDVSNIIVLDFSTFPDWGNARYAVYLFNDKTTGWLDMSSVAFFEQNGEKKYYYYAVDISNLEFTPTKFIVCRMNQNSENNCYNRINQTAELEISKGLYVKIPANYWNGGELGDNQRPIGV